MLNGLDLFSGIGGLTLALAPWVRTIAYCENDRYAQSVLLSRMRHGDLACGPIWDDVCTLRREALPVVPDIVFGGFPCQDISVAGAGKGLDGERSGLFFEIVRLTRDIRPRFVFLENVPAISVRGLDRVLLEFTALGYDCRWTIVSAAEVGAPHLRERWFLLAHATSQPWRLPDEERKDCLETVGGREAVADANGLGLRIQPERVSGRWQDGVCGEGDTKSVNACEEWTMADSQGQLQARESAALGSGMPVGNAHCARSQGTEHTKATWAALAQLRHSGGGEWPSWLPKPALRRGDDGLLRRVDRLRGLGNAVVPLQARTAFARLLGIEGW